MTMRADVALLDRPYRAKRSGQSPVEYAASIQRYRRPRRNWGAWAVTLALLAGCVLMLRSA